jgi:predicted lactoylglutathione lyase
MVSPNIGKEDTMQKQETQEEVLERVLMKLSKLSDSQIDQLVRLANEQGIELE